MRYFLFISILFICACGPTPYFEEAIDVDSNNWNYDQKVNFTVDTNDTLSMYNMHLIVSHSDEFSYQNLYLNITTSFPSQEDRQERLNIELSDEKGQWVGKCSGGICQTKVYLIDDFKFPEEGKYNFSVEQLSREENLKGISQLALEIFKAEDKS